MVVRHAVTLLTGPGRSSAPPGAWRTDETRPPLGIWSPEGAEPEVQLSYRVSYRVDDIAAAVERVRAATRTSPSAIRTGCSPTASMTRVRRSVSGSRSIDRLALARAPRSAGWRLGLGGRAVPEDPAQDLS
jgi:hypothetical protein